MNYFSLKNSGSMLIASTLFLSGCATPPKELIPSNTSIDKYKAEECASLSKKMNTTAEKINRDFEVLNDRADGDTTKAWIGSLLLWPVLFLLDGDDEKTTEYRLALGDFEAMRQTAKEKECRFTIPTIPEFMNEDDAAKAAAEQKEDKWAEDF
jgi:hypothetical protein